MGPAVETQLLTSSPLLTVKTVNNMSLQNMIMQLRKTCAHPFLFFWPRDPDTQEEIVGKELERASGKMMLLDRLLESLIGKHAKVDKKTKRPHKVLIFSQFTRMLDIIEVSSSTIRFPLMVQIRN